MTPENEKKYQTFLKKLGREIMYFTNTFEEAAIKSVPPAAAIKHIPGIWAKFKGQPEYSISGESNLVNEAILEYNEITKEQYDNW
jgi:hypothetical protein